MRFFYYRTWHKVELLLGDPTSFTGKQFLVPILHNGQNDFSVGTTCSKLINVIARLVLLLFYVFFCCL